jgi:hypothetical protein
MSTIFFDMSIVVASPGREGAFRCVSRVFPSRSLPPPAGSSAPASRRRGAAPGCCLPATGKSCLYGFFGFHPAFDAQGHLIPVPSYRKFELGTYIEYGLTNWLTLVASPSYDRIHNPPPGQRDRGESRALPHGYERPFVSSRLALARRLVRRFARAVRGAPRRFPRCPGPGRAQRRRRGDGGFRRSAGRVSLLRRRSAGRMADRSDDGTAPVAEDFS